MKNILLSAGAMLIASVAFAQTPATVPATTPSAIAVPTPQVSPTLGATVGGNYSNINQKAVGSNALVEQQGTANASYIDQTGSDVGNKNNVYVKQWGNVQPSISGYQNHSEITQDGAGNDFTALQQGDTNMNFGSQVGLDNTVMVKQGANAAQQAQDNVALSDQDGKDNSAEIEQYYDNNMASITQRNDQVAGVGNQSYQLQTANPNQTAGHTAIGEQWGDDNKLVQMQDSGSPASGGANHAEAYQGDATAGAVNAFAQQLQSGDNNEAYSNQFGVNDESFQEQNGSANVAVARQNTLPTNGGDNLLEQYQEGTGNRASADQNGSNNQSFQEQYGTNNSAVLTQRQGQIVGNVALSIQEGMNHQSEINQKTSGNMATVDQTGHGQMSIVNQNYPAGNGTTAQAGAGYNSATVIQRDANVALTPQIQRANATRARF